MADTPISFDECCRIILVDWPWRRESAAAELRNYKRHLLRLLTGEFGITWDDTWVNQPNLGPFGLSCLACAMPRGYCGLCSPWSSFLEYSPLEGELQVIGRHRPRLDERLNALQQEWAVLFRDLLLLQWPEAAGRQSSWARLRALGLSDPLYEDDFF